MYKYENGTLYIGDIIRKTNGVPTVAKKQAFLIYSKNEDCFYTLDVLNYLLDLEVNKSLSEEQREEYKEIVETNKYNYKNIDEDEVYIDENSVEEAFNKVKTK